MSFDEAMQEVLEQSRYDELTGRKPDIKGVIEDALQRFANSIAERLHALDFTEASEINLDAVAVFFAVVGVLVLLMTVILIIRRKRLPKKPATFDLSDVYEEIVKRNLSAGEWLAKSRELEAKAAFRDAVRYAYMAALVGLQEKKIIRIDASKTNTQIARELSLVAPALEPTFEKVTGCFHRIWFGYKPLGVGEFATVSAAAEELIT